MHWHYQIRRWRDTGSVYFDIVEVYHDDPPDAPSWTENSIAPIADTREELIETLELMLADARKYPVFEVADEQ